MSSQRSGATAREVPQLIVILSAGAQGGELGGVLGKGWDTSEI